MKLNVSKCEVIAHDQISLPPGILSSFQRVPISEVCLLGSPLFSGPSLDKAWSERCDLARAVERSRSIGSQEALILLRASFGTPRVTHLLRCSPSRDHPGLQGFDCLLRAAVSHITNSNLSDTQWVRASLPVRDGGLGIRRYLRSQCQLFCLLRPVLPFSRLTSCQTALTRSPVPNLFWPNILRHGRLSLDRQLATLFPSSSRRGMGTWWNLRRLKFKVAVLIRGSELPFWRSQRLIRETGFTPYPFPLVD